MQALDLQLWAVTLLCAELFLVIVRTAEINVLVRSSHQRTPDERKRISGGLGRSFLLEVLLFVPVSVLLVLITIPPLVVDQMGATASSARLLSVYGLLGIASYGFPFATVRRLVTRIALTTLREFASIAHSAGSEGGPPSLKEQPKEIERKSQLPT
jgi:hypothetical protein